MIIECEQCRSKFNLDESLLKRDGSRVRCSICKTIFTAYPPELQSVPGRMELEETVALDSPPILAEREGAAPEEAQNADFDKAFEQALDEQPPEPVSLDQIPLETEPEIAEAAEPEEGVAVGDLGAEEVKEERHVPKPAGKRSIRPLSAALIIVLILLGGSAAVYLYAPEILPESLSFLKPAQKQDVSDTGVARLSFGNVKGTFVQSEKEGQLFVIQGVITNNYPKPRSSILIRGALLDDKGQAVRTKMAYAGNQLTDDQIKTMSLVDVNNEMKNRLGRQNANASVKPEAAVPFTIVIENLPENLSEFTVEAVSSSPGQP